VLGLESSQRLGARARTPEVDDLFRQLEVDLAHAAIERQIATTSSTNLSALIIFSIPCADLGEVRHRR
jgi:hypothetical protein